MYRQHRRRGTTVDNNTKTQKLASILWGLGQLSSVARGTPQTNSQLAHG